MGDSSSPAPLLKEHTATQPCEKAAVSCLEDGKRIAGKFPSLRKVLALAEFKTPAKWCLNTPGEIREALGSQYPHPSPQPR